MVMPNKTPVPESTSSEDKEMSEKAVTYTKHSIIYHHISHYLSNYNSGRSIPGITNSSESMSINI